MARRKKLPLITDLEITDIAAEGKSIARYDNMVVFIPNLVPGDVADVQVVRKKKKYMEGFCTELKKESEIRTIPFCAHFGVCGGCKWQILSYEKQLYFKQKQVSDHLQRIGRVSLPEMNPILGSEQQQYYRNKLEYTFSSSRWLSDAEIKSGAEIDDRRALGFHLPGKFDRILDIDTCYLQNDLSNRIRNRIRDYTLQHDYTYFDHRSRTGLMRNLIIRNSNLGEWMVIVVFQYDEHEKIDPLINMLAVEFPDITSLMYVINPKLNDTINDLDIQLYSGRDHIIEELDGLKFRIGPKSFFQTNTSQALRLYRTALEFAELKGEELVYDLYTGTGTIANFISSHCKNVIGIENVGEAIKDAKVNSRINNIHNTQFFTGDIKDVLTPEFFTNYGRPDVIITDPPRAGMHPDVVKAIKESLPEIIVYISCNPATQARDIQLLSDVYHVNRVQPVDMFPQTHHVENIVRLDRIPVSVEKQG